MAIKEPLSRLDDTKITGTRNQKQYQSVTAKTAKVANRAGAMIKTLYAIAAAAIVAACFVLSPSLTPQVEAGAPALDGKSDRADARVIGGDCSQRAWPYYEASCLRDTGNRLTPPRDVRFVPLENVPHKIGTSAVALR
jgi:hypothetical protein